jgi:hypothetical protein
MLAYQGFINMSSRLLLLDSWIQGFFTWLHGFKVCLLVFMASILKKYPFFTTTSSSSMLHPYHYYHIIIITDTLTSMPTFSQHLIPLVVMHSHSIHHFVSLPLWHQWKRDHCFLSCDSPYHQHFFSLPLDIHDKELLPLWNFMILLLILFLLLYSCFHPLSFNSFFYSLFHQWFLFWL